LKAIEMDNSSQNDLSLDVVRETAQARILFDGCPLCSSKEIAVVVVANCSQHPLYHPTLPPKMNWKSCRDCGHIFTDGYFSAEALDLIFGKTNLNQTTGYNFEQQRPISAKMVESVTKYARIGRWLDVGFGNGSLLFTAAEWGYVPVGLDLRSSSVELMREMGFEAYCLELEDLKVDKKFSVISMADVLEHMPFPKKALIASKDLLEEKGVLFLSMPSYGSPVWQLLDREKRNPYWGEMEHYHNFSRQRLYDLLEETGFSPLNYSISDRYRVGMEIVAQLKTSATIRPNPKREETGTDQSEVFSKALALHQQGKLPEAKKLYEELLNKNPNHFDALHLSGVLAHQLQRLEEAEVFYAKAIRIHPSYAPLHCHRGNMLKALRRFDEALESYDKAILLQNDYALAFNNRGNALQELKRLDEALASYDKAISNQPNYADAFNNRADILSALRRFDEALMSYDQAISLQAEFFLAFYNRGNALRKLKRFDDALASYDKAISIQSDYAEVFNNRGITLLDLNRLDEGLASFDKAISIKSDYADAFNNRGNTLRALRRFDEALASYHRAILIKSDYEFLFGSLLHLRMEMSEWSNLEQTLSEFQFKIKDVKIVTTPFPVLALFDDLELNLRLAQQWIDNRFQTKPLASPFSKNYPNTKIRIGYFSADFHNHPTAYLMAELFERHDLTKFELYAFSFGPDSVDEMRQRLEVSFDKFFDVKFQSDQEVAELSRSLGVDIAVDLKGFTTGARTSIFAHRCAPVQVSYIGYPGTMAADFIDYIIADKILIPTQSQKSYSEKVVYLPDSYQINDSKREISKKDFTRIELGLPEEGFVFCCFNNSYKILPDVFNSWMRILKAVEGSVIWLLDSNDSSVCNLKREASNLGISPERLVFAKFMPLPDHLARHSCADLFLDTHPCNAHTTASDALWAGLPVLTRIGESFAARVAASLLNAVGLPELITTSVDEYEQLAIRLATHPDEVRALKQKLSDERLSSKLFDTPLYVRHLEAAYTEMYDRHQAGLEPDHIYIQDEGKTD